MSTSTNKREEVAARLDSPSNSRETPAKFTYPSPPSSPPQTDSITPNIRREKRDEFSSSRAGLRSLPTPPTSPPRVSSDVTPQKEKPVLAQPRLDATALRTLLGLDDWRCGAMKSNGEPCRMRIFERAQGQINRQIESMMKLKRSSPVFVPELDKLVMLVHCRYHNSGYTKDSRIEAWDIAFPIGTDENEPGISDEKQIRRALGRISTLCRGKNRDGTQCENRMGGQKVQNCAKTINEIVKPEIYCDDDYLDGLLRVLAVNMFCHYHKDKQGLDEVAKWKLRITEIRQKATSESVLVASETKAVEQPNTQKQALSAQGTQSCSSDARRSPVVQPQATSKPSRSLSPKFNQDPATYWPKEYDTTPLGVIERSTNSADYKSSYALVQSEVIKSLDRKDKAGGYVYLYEVEGSEGYVKIGYTSRDIKSRHEEWEFDCNRLPKLLYPVSEDCTIVINARRVEALCHAELNHRRIKIYCTGCLKQHIEWFEMTSAEAIRVIQKWSKWMATCPYQSGTLKKEERQRISNVNDFMKELTLAAEEIEASELKGKDSGNSAPSRKDVRKQLSRDANREEQQAGMKV